VSLRPCLHTEGSDVPSADADRESLHVYPSSEKETVPTDSRLQRDTQLCCDPACFETAAAQTDCVRTHSPETAYSYKDNNFQNILILTCTGLQSKIGIYRKKQFLKIKILPFLKSFMCPNHLISEKHDLEQTAKALIHVF